ncbi:hypothetical protein BUALT_Bualt15G0112300 [Buddleja alternifolia]|uniref:Cytochrome c-552/DMSO reductase-like haem-binding domain-containing protein n=1 Tax=Buddleja alternifolia TaxID=168488 RepID=A0AAV6WEN2_9LAMI|nr:hypothetical protein BUALT_Bualt15G0112300 [Buddleja alternifolia]
MSHPFLLLLHLFLLAACIATAHEESGEWHCDPDDEARIGAQFRPGIVTLDGHADDWADVDDGFDFPLRPALDPDEDNEYKPGKMTLKALHDGADVYFMLQVNGDYLYSKGGNIKEGSIRDIMKYSMALRDKHKCPSLALMFQVGENATYHNMGGCKESPDTCNSTNCRGHEVDIMHFSIGNSIPGRLYGGDSVNGVGQDERIGLVDMYSWNPHCRNIDGNGPSGNDSTAVNNWKGAWWHSSFSTHSGKMHQSSAEVWILKVVIFLKTSFIVRWFIEDDSPYGSAGQKGTYYFEFSRPLRTMDRFQQDAQFSIGQSSRFSAAFWYPADGKPWHGSGHYTVSCDWVPMDVIPAYSTQLKGASGSSWDAAGGFAFVLSIVAFCISIFVGYMVSKNKSVPFTPIDHL